MSITDPTVSTDPTTNLVMTGLRDAIKLGGAYLVANGVASSSQVQLWGGLAVIIGGVIWSGVASWMKHQKAAVATTAVMQLSSGSATAATAALNRAQLTLKSK